MMEHASAAHAAIFEYLLVFAAAIALVWTLALALRYTVDPRESDPGHIKHRILLDEVDEVEEGRSR